MDDDQWQASSKDEQDAIAYIVRRGVDGYRDTLRAQVESLPTWESANSLCLLRADVLALLDGAPP